MFKFFVTAGYPPFSLMREFVDVLEKYSKKYLIIGNMNAVSYKEIFKLIKDRKIWFGNTKVTYFVIPNEYDLIEATVYKNGVKIANVGNGAWFTNLKQSKNNPELLLTTPYSELEHPKYDNYDAIEVGSIRKIPFDYYGVIGVPVNFVFHHNPKQFEIVGVTDRLDSYNLKTKKYTIQDSKKYADLNGTCVLNKNGILTPVYKRILIKRIISE